MKKWRTKYNCADRLDFWHVLEPASISKAMRRDLRIIGGPASARDLEKT